MCEFFDFQIDLAYYLYLYGYFESGHLDFLGGVLVEHVKDYSPRRIFQSLPRHSMYGIFTYIVFVYFHHVATFCFGGVWMMGTGGEPTINLI